MRCVTTSPTVAVARSTFGSPNSGVFSVALVLQTKAEASRYYAMALAAIPGCVRRSLAGGHPTLLARQQHLALGRYGSQSTSWRLRFRNSDGTRRSVDWVVVKTNRAVLTDVFIVAYFDAHWKDRSELAGVGGPSLTLERRIVVAALVRAAAVRVR
jgi:hypothetical protein